MGGRGPAGPQVNLLRILELLQTHITPALCHAVFGRVRRTERQRVWTLDALVRFWTAVILRAPTALSQALADAREDREPLFPDQGDPRSLLRALSGPAARVLRRGVPSLHRTAGGRRAAALCSGGGPICQRFADVVILDGSRLAAIAHRLKLLWKDRAVVLPGCLLGVYDVRRGLCRRLVFHADAAASELTRATAVLSDLARDTLVLGDRLYGTAAFFEALYGQRSWGLVRHNHELSLHKLQRLRKRRHADGMLEDWLVRRLRRLGPDPVVALHPVAPGRDPL